jgi:hypothetical protein
MIAGSILSQDERDQIEQSLDILADQLALFESVDAALKKQKHLARAMRRQLATATSDTAKRSTLTLMNQRMHCGLQAQENARESLRNALENLSTVVELLGHDLQSQALSRFRLCEGSDASGTL